ncbi:uPF0301 protein Fbal_2930 [Sutterella sp. CAG:351]|mgnify:FL=1|uniref:YqgE/AlgH family protein n=2 Tax=Dakarella massiliensis TaxID=1506471 RepID=UPI00033CBA52|nr:YqgE/AlgH family protein [Dakarella massiliensis]CDE51747.1 uPF0301 protein Fbal_2930 [Sutterella sp. CAG:351]
MDENMELQNHLLVAMPSLRDPNFAGTVVYITGHDEKGSRGFVINRQTELMLSDVLEQSKVIAKGSPRLPDRVFIGGPVDPQRGFLLHEKAGEYAASREISPTLCVTLSADVLSRMCRGEGPRRRLFLLGLAGWLPGQLEAEIALGSWITVPGTEEILFDVPPEERYDYALRQIGISREQLEASEEQAGHA